MRRGILPLLLLGALGATGAPPRVYVEPYGVEPEVVQADKPTKQRSSGRSSGKRRRAKRGRW